MPNLGLIRDFISEKMRATLGGNRVKYRATSQTEVLLDVGFHGRLTKASSAIAAYRTGDGTKTDEFSEQFQRGGGSLSIQKNLLKILGL